MSLCFYPRPSAQSLELALQALTPQPCRVPETWPDFDTSPTQAPEVQALVPSLKAAHRAECTFTADESCRKGFFGLRAGPAGSTSSRKSRLINRAGILHSLTRSSSWHWSSHKHSYNTPTQQTQRALTYSAGRGGKKKKGHAAR